MTRYVAGFLFSPELDQVALILKARPEWQRGKYNGVGGHVEEGEGIHTAMRREFKEEAGVEIEPWNRFAILRKIEWTVDFFWAIGDLDTLHGLPDEPVHIFPVDSLPSNFIENIAWLVPLALDVMQRGTPLFVEASYD